MVYFGIKSLNSPSTISDAKIIKSFLKSNWVVISKGSDLCFHSIVEKKLQSMFSFHLFGEIVHIINLTQFNNCMSSILLILNDGRFTVLKDENNKIVSAQTGNLFASFGVREMSPFLYSVRPGYFMIKLTHNVIQFFQVEDLKLSLPFNITLNVKNIIDIEFVFNHFEHPKIAALVADFSGKTKLVFYDIDILNQIGTLLHSLDLPISSYKIISVDYTNLVVLSTDIAIKISFMQNSYHIETSTIFTSRPLKTFAKIANNQFLVSDNDRNLMELIINKQIKIFRIGEVNNPISILPISEEMTISISKYGECEMISLNNSSDILYSSTSTIKNNPGGVCKIIEIDNDGYIGFCQNNFSQIIRETFQIEDCAMTLIYNINNVWRYRENCFIVTLNKQTMVLSLNQKSEIIVIKDSFIIDDASTIAFDKVENDMYVQITDTTIHNSKGQKISYDLIEQASISKNNIVISVQNNNSESKYKIIILDLSLNEISSFNVNYNFNAITSNDKFVGILSWEENSIYIFSIDNQSLIKVFSDVSAISISFIKNYFVILEIRDHCKYYSLDGFEEVYDYFCEGNLNSIINLSNDDILLTGEKPVIISNGSIKSVGNKEFTKAAISISENMIAYIKSDKFFLGILSQPKFSISDLITDKVILNSVKIENEKLYVNEISNGDNSYLELNEYPLSKSIAISQPKPYKSYTGFSLIKINGKLYSAVINDENLSLFEIIDNNFIERSSINLKKIPIDIITFNQMFLLCFKNEIQLYQLEHISATNISLTKISSFNTQGSSSSISSDEPIIAVSDSLRSIILYEYDERLFNFAEIARCCYNFGFSKCKIFGDDIFCFDNFNNLYDMQIGDTKNIESTDLKIISTYSFKKKILSIEVMKDKSSYIFGSEDNEYFQIVHLTDIDNDFQNFYNTIQRKLKTIGNFSSFTNGVVLYNDCIIPSQTIINIDLLVNFMKLSQESQLIICSEANISNDYAQTICTQMISLLR